MRKLRHMLTLLFKLTFKQRMRDVKGIGSKNSKGFVEAWFIGEKQLGGWCGTPGEFAWAEQRHNYTVIYKVTRFITIPHMMADGEPKFYGDLEVVEYVSNDRYENWLKEFKLYPYV